MGLEKAMKLPRISYSRRIKLPILVFISTLIFLRVSLANAAIDLCEDNVETLVGTASTDFSIHGIRLGLTQEEAWQILYADGTFIGEIDKSNPSRIYVYGKNRDGAKGDSLLYLIWEPTKTGMSQISIFQGFRKSLAPNFRRLMTFEAVDNGSAFKKAFIGYANRSEITLDIPSIGTKHRTFFYDDIGIEVVHQHHSGDEQVMFSIVKPDF